MNDMMTGMGAQYFAQWCGEQGQVTPLVRAALRQAQMPVDHPQGLDRVFVLPAPVGQGALLRIFTTAALSLPAQAATVLREAGFCTQAHAGAETTVIEVTVDRMGYALQYAITAGPGELTETTAAEWGRALVRGAAEFDRLWAARAAECARQWAAEEGAAVVAPAA